MSLSIHHPSGKVTSTTALTFEVQGGTPTVPKNINLTASSVVMPNVQQPVGQSGALIFDSSTKRMKYYDGAQWISWIPSDEITGPIEQDLADIYAKLGTKVDSVIYNSSSIPTASISGTTLNITFPTGNSGGTGIPGLFTSLPPGSITQYSLISGQTPASIREQMGGVTGAQNGRNGTQGAPFITTTGWCFADGNYWLWRGPNGDVVQRVPNLNQNAYLKAMSTSGITKTDTPIGSSGAVGATILGVAHLPPHNFSVSGSTNVTGGHTHTMQSLWSARMSIDDVRVGVFRQGYSGYDGGSTSVAGDHSHVFSGVTNTIGSGQGHDHSLLNVDVDHFNVAMLYNIAQPSIALNQDVADGRYVLKSGDIMTGTLTISSSAVIRGDDTNLMLWFRNSANADRAVIYHNNSNNTLRLRANGGTEIVINNSGSLTAGSLTAGTVTSNGALNGASAVISGNTRTATLTVTGAVTATSLTTTGAINSGSLTSSTLSISGAASTGLLTVSGGLNVTGKITATDDIWGFSDERLKENIVKIENCLDKVDSIDGIFANMIGDVNTRSMVLAQQVQKVLPEAVEEDENGYLKVSYQALIPLLLNAVSDLRAEVKELRGKK